MNRSMARFVLFCLTEKASGWPALQVQILQELTGTARRLGNIPLAIRHAALLVHMLLMHQLQVAARTLHLPNESSIDDYRHVHDVIITSFPF